MSASNFRASLSLVLAHEGGYVNHPADPGGATNFGVTQKVYDAYRKYMGAKPQSVKHITSSEVSEIYQKNYWRLCRADSLPCGLDYAVFDFGVNSGVSRAVRYLQRVVGVEDDGVLGMISMAAIEAAAKANEEALIVKYVGARIAFVRSLGTFKVFGKGWMRRIVGMKEGHQESDKGVLDYAITMARRDPIFNVPSPIGSFADEAPAKAVSPTKSEAFPVVEGIYTASALKQIAAANDELDRLIRNA